jgi:hypothetical protein
VTQWGFRSRPRQQSVRRRQGHQEYIDVSSVEVRWLDRQQRFVWLETRSQSRVPWGGPGDGPALCASGLTEPEP